MASDEQFSLCWNNFHANMSAGFHGLLSRGDLVDVTLAAEGRLLQAHKLVLSVCSPFFQEMFKMNPTQHPIVFLKDVSHSALRDLLQFMYQGEVNVKQEELASFISTAEQLQVKGLTGNQNEESSTPSKPKPTSRPGPRSSQQRQSVMTKLETDLDSKPSSTPVAVKRPNRPSIASNNSSSSQSGGPVKRKCVDPLEAGPSGSAKDEFVTIPDEDENNAVAPKMEPEFVNESMWDDDDDGTNNDETNFGEDDSNMEMSGFDGSATGDGTLTGTGEGAVGDAQGLNDITDEDILKFDLLTDADEGIVLHVLPEEEEMVEENLEELEEEMVEENLEIQEEEIGTEEAANEKDTDIAMFVESRRGKTVLQFNGYRYRKLYKNRQGTRWACSAKKTCSAYVYTNDNNEIIITNQSHNHDPPKRCDFIDNDQDDTAVVITSRKGKEMLLFRQYTYRKQYDKGMKTRWVCSTLKNCKACIFTDESNYITSSFDEHIHDPPQYYTKPKNILQALREPLILDTD